MNAQLQALVGDCEDLAFFLLAHKKVQLCQQKTVCCIVYNWVVHDQKQVLVGS